MTYKLLVISIFFSLPCSSHEKTDTVQQLNEVVISGFKPGNAKFTSLNIEGYSLKKLDEFAPFNLSDALAKTPGISQITTGNSIAKPVIRGLYGNRILILLSGLRFDNQQWQDEHGLGLSQIGINSVEIIKGPASLLYGSDALGGVINVIEEKPTGSGITVDIGTQIYSNTRGTLTDIGISQRTGRKWWRLRLGGESQADYSDGNNIRVLNSRNNGYYVKAGFGFERAHWIQENSYNFSYNQFGFILNDLSTVFQADERWSRSLAGPHHNVMLNLLHSQNTFLLKGSTLRLNVGLQSNKREEDEGGGQISLNIHLLSALQNLKWEKPLSKALSFVINQQCTFEQNTNYGSRILIPDATFIENNVSCYVKYSPGKYVIEAGIGGNDKYIKTVRTKTLNTPGEPIQPFARNNTTANGMVGSVYNLTDRLTLKANIASGFRAPNLAELSSNGLHEGVYRYELGDPNLKIEQNINGDFLLEFETGVLFFSSSVFYNRFFNYIYLSPTNGQFYGFPVFKFEQQDARLYGSENFIAISPKHLQNWHWKEGYTLTYGVLDNGLYLPFIPAAKLTSALRWERKLNKKIKNVYAEPEFICVFQQDRPAEFETPTGAYHLLNCNIGTAIAAHRGDWNICVSGTNLTNELYADHLSRLKYYGLYNTGINIVLSVRRNF